LAQAAEDVGTSLRIVESDSRSTPRQASQPEPRRRLDETPPGITSSPGATQLKVSAPAEPNIFADFSQPPAADPNGIEQRQQTEAGPLLLDPAPSQSLPAVSERSVATSAPGTVDLVVRPKDAPDEASRPRTLALPASFSSFEPSREEPNRRAEIALAPATELKFQAVGGGRAGGAEDPAPDMSQVVQRLPKVLDSEDPGRTLLDQEVQVASYQSQPSRSEITSAGDESTGTADAAVIAEESTTAAGEDALGPFAVSDHQGELRLAVGRSKTLRSKANVVGSSVVDPNVCAVVQLAAGGLSIAGKGPGTTDVTFWFDDERQKPVTLLVRVEAGDQPSRSTENRQRILQEVLKELFPKSNVKLKITDGRWLVQGRVPNAAEAAQILAVVRDQAGAAARATGGAAAPDVVNMLRAPSP
jgi:hypothetical protein